jgi:hypothetical protein
VRLRRGIKAWGKYLAGHLEVRGRAARGGRRRREKAAGVNRHGGEDTADKQGPLDREMMDWRPAREGANQKGKRISREDAIDARAGWAGRDSFNLRGRHGRWAGWARGQADRKVGRAEIKKKNFRIKNCIFQFTKALEICERRFRRNFDMRIFPKFF